MRTRLFAELQAYNDRLEKLTATSDIVTKLEASRQATVSKPSSPVDTALCKFWNYADRLYRVLLETWNCGCREHHSAQLILQHRVTPEKDFRLNLSSSSHGVVGPNPWPASSVRVKMLERTGGGLAISVVKESASTVSVPISTPQHQPKMPLRSVLASAPGKKVALSSTATVHAQVNPVPPFPRAI